MSNTLMSITLNQICFKSYFHCSHCDKLVRLSAVTVFAWSLAGRKHQTRPDHEPSVSTRTPLGLHAAWTNIHAGGRRHTHNSTYTWTWWLGKHVKITGQYSNPLWSPSEATLSWSNAPSGHGGQRCKEERKARKEKNVKNCEDEHEWQWIYMNIMFNMLCKANAELSSKPLKFTNTEIPSVSARQTEATRCWNRDCWEGRPETGQVEGVSGGIHLCFGARKWSIPQKTSKAQKVWQNFAPSWIWKQQKLWMLGTLLQ